MISPDLIPWLLAPAIFLARVADVSLGTVRIIIGFRGYRWLAALIGFVEALIWVLAVRQVLLHLDAQPWLAVAYASGFAAGNYLGISLERRLGVGRELVRAICYREDASLAGHLREAGYRVVELEGKGKGGRRVQVVYVVERRRKVPALVARIAAFDAEAIYTVADVKTHVGEEGDLPPESGFSLRFKRK
ncbi:DUF2179 domain-containing protein [Pseudomarimonas salicorniae]|uniref:DUF5698 domain-containing protein n=1 Tax=Pseudomarimonas salicorniae TaxID=2933270 RepID=A0ABT0GE56_9GAMM|nr:DUF5698 domain-containing protein [Lysobacter sp. CAU 1642]MCK7592833.1 DUF5698 domain-containing protein [Lysobacter sp. CAU 1642]